MKIKDTKGFTLIELLIVVAIIAILAAIAIPQFSAYRIRGFNASANSDVRNLATTEEALFADSQAYGSTTIGVLATANCAATGTLVDGPRNPGSLTTGSTGAFVQNSGGSVGFSVSNRVNIVSTGSAGGTTAGCTSYVLVAKHNNGDACFGRDSDSTSSLRATSLTSYILAAGDVPAANTPAVDLTAGSATTCSNFTPQ